MGKVIFVPYNGKIADITKADTNNHFLDLAAALGETRKIIVVIVRAYRVSGVGTMFAYPNEGSQKVQIGNSLSGQENTLGVIGIADGTGQLQYSQGLANDDWDLYCFGYWVQA